MGQLRSLGQPFNTGLGPAPAHRPSWVFVTPAPVSSGSLPRDCPDWPSVITGVTPGYGSQQFSDSYTPVAPLIHEVELSPFPFCPACLHVLARAQCPPCSTPGYVWIVMTYRGPGRPRVGCLLSSVLRFFHGVLEL